MAIKMKGKHYTVIDDFLPKEEFEEIRYNICNSESFTWSFVKHVSTNRATEIDVLDKERDQLWCWYFVHMLYRHNIPRSEFFEPVYNCFIPKFEEMGIFQSLIRIKANFYPHTETLREHELHEDYDKYTKGALFSLNTCDGYTGFKDGSKVESVSNRLLLFDTSVPHHSTTTTTCEARWNLNFNFL